jgi:hypothetical protein
LFQHSPIDEPDSDNGANDGNNGIGIDRRKKMISRWNSTRKQMKKRKTKIKLKLTSEGRRGPSVEQGDQKGKLLFLSFFLGGVLARIFRVHW